MITRLKDTETIRAQAWKLLNALGNKPEIVAQNLLAGGYLGRRGSEDSCPVATYLNRSELGLPRVRVIGNTAVFDLPDAPAGVGDYVDMPDACEEFVYLFDIGRFPELVKPSLSDRMRAAHAARFGGAR